MICRDVLGSPNPFDRFDWFNDAADTYRWLCVMEVEHHRADAQVVRWEMLRLAPAGWARVLRDRWPMPERPG